MKMNKDVIKKDDGRYLIYYTFDEDNSKLNEKQEKQHIKKDENGVNVSGESRDKGGN